MSRILLTMALLIIFCSCHRITGSGNIITQERHLAEFEGIKASGSIDVEIISGQSQLVKVEADDNILPYIITKIEDGLLEVHLKSGFSYNDLNAKVYVISQSLQKLIVSGSCNLTTKDTVKNDTKIETKLSGSGDIIALVDAPFISAVITGSGSITLAGRTKDFNSNIVGSGDIKCNKLLSENTTATITGSGTARVFASVHLIAKLTGSGDIYYSGNPVVEIHKTGSGTVKAEK